MTKLAKEDWICLHCSRIGSRADWEREGVHVDEDSSCSICDGLCYQVEELEKMLARAGLHLVRTSEQLLLETTKEFWAARAVVQKLSQAEPKENPAWARFDAARAAFYAAAEEEEL